jgi:hypothetical protein
MSLGAQTAQGGKDSPSSYGMGEGTGTTTTAAGPQTPVSLGAGAEFFRDGTPSMPHSRNISPR